MDKKVYQAPRVVSMTAGEVLTSLGHATASVYGFTEGGGGIGD